MKLVWYDYNIAFNHSYHFLLADCYMWLPCGWATLTQMLSPMCRGDLMHCIHTNAAFVLGLRYVPYTIHTVSLNTGKPHVKWNATERSSLLMRWELKYYIGATWNICINSCEWHNYFNWRITVWGLCGGLWNCISIMQFKYMVYVSVPLFLELCMSNWWFN